VQHGYLLLSVTGEKRMITPVKTDPFILRETVSEAGYEWLKGMDGRPRLVPRHAPGAGYRVCVPHPGLFREFAKLSPTRDAIQGFAGQYGDLFNRYAFEQGAGRDDGTVAHGSSLGTWTKEIEDMRVLIELWQDIQQRRVAALKMLIKWTAKDVGYVLTTPKHKADVTIAHADIPGSGFGRFSRKDIVLPARCALQMEINKRIAEQPAVPRLAWTPDSHQRLIFVPPNLLGAMWLQFAQAVAGEFELYPCDACGKFFQRGPGGRRADATTCSDACRQRKKRKPQGGTP
jgi:hypothetical protein